MDFKKEKKGWLKIFETSISITLILGFMILFYSQSIIKPKTSENILKWEVQILESIKDNPLLKEEILDDKNLGVCKDTLETYKFIEERLKNSFMGFNFSCVICKSEDICGPGEYKEEIFSEEITISGNPKSLKPKKLRIFVWKEK
ncbi:MAG: hypothetical protein QXF25_01445 [Candidatus Pacearchaeota archaeon]